jgi:hypothetical protein
MSADQTAGPLKAEIKQAIVRSLGCRSRRRDQDSPLFADDLGSIRSAWSSVEIERSFGVAISDEETDAGYDRWTPLPIHRRRGRPKTS